MWAKILAAIGPITELLKLVADWRRGKRRFEQGYNKHTLEESDALKKQARAAADARSDIGDGGLSGRVRRRGF